jgi:hypothetical protein
MNSGIHLEGLTEVVQESSVILETEVYGCRTRLLTVRTNFLQTRWLPVSVTWVL